MVDKTYMAHPTTKDEDDGVLQLPEHYKDQFSPRRGYSKALVQVHSELAHAERDEALTELGDTNRTVSRLIEVITSQGTTISKLIKRVRNINKTLNIEIYTYKKQIEEKDKRITEYKLEFRRLKEVEKERDELLAHKNKVSEKRRQAQYARHGKGSKSGNNSE
jgi:small-conductance mechanosensitive channel